jgi:hypothetical protein
VHDSQQMILRSYCRSTTSILSKPSWELVENMENTEHVRELYKIRKRAVGDSKNAGISASEVSRVRNCMRQGRELYLAGKSGSLMVKTA